MGLYNGTAGNTKLNYGIELKCDTLTIPKDTTNIMDKFFRLEPKKIKMTDQSDLLLDPSSELSSDISQKDNLQKTKENMDETIVFKDSTLDYYNDNSIDNYLNVKLKNILRELKINDWKDFENFLDTGIDRWLREREKEIKLEKIGEEEKNVKIEEKLKYYLNKNEKTFKVVEEKKEAENIERKRLENIIYDIIKEEKIDRLRANIDLFEQWLILALQSDDLKARLTAKYYYILHQEELDDFILDIVMKRKNKRNVYEESKNKIESENKIFDKLFLEKNRYKNEVKQLFKTIIGRYPDQSELIHYSNMLKYKIIGTGKIEYILKNSSKYKNKTSKIPDRMTDEYRTDDINNLIKDDKYYTGIIDNAYKEVLKRNKGMNNLYVDESGIKTYLPLMKDGMTKEELCDVLKNSQEYKDNFGDENLELDKKDKIGKVQIQVSKITPKIVYCMMGTNRLVEIKPYIETVLPYIDKFIFIDGESEDGTIEYLNSLDKNKVEVYVHKWQDRFSAQRNNYLNKLKERDYNGWVIVSDSDEHYPVDSLKRIKELIPQIEDKAYNGIQVQVIDILVDDDDFNSIIDSKKNEYWKSLVFRFSSDLRYEGEPHETLIGLPIRWFTSDIIYEHRRSKLHILSRATENYFISNSNRYSERWAEFRFLCTKNGLLIFNEYWKLFEKHELPKEIEDWLIKHKDDNLDSGDSELRETSLLYFEILPGRAKKKQLLLRSNIPEVEKVSDNIQAFSQDVDKEKATDKYNVSEAPKPIYQKYHTHEVYEVRIQRLDEGFLVTSKDDIDNEWKQYAVSNSKLVLKKIGELLGEE